MRRMFVLLACLATLVSLSAAGVPVSERYLRAYEAWYNGDYLVALYGFKQVLASPDGSAYLERIAEVTGEVYRVVEFTSDGRLPRFSPNGRHAAYETGSPAVT